MRTLIAIAGGYVAKLGKALSHGYPVSPWGGNLTNRCGIEGARSPSGSVRELGCPG